MWPVMTFYTNSAIHMIAHGAWAQVLMGGAAMELGPSQREAPQRLVAVWGCPPGSVVSGAAFLVHEQNAWLFQRSAFLHHLLGWTLVVASIFPLVRVFRPRSQLAATGFALTFVVVAGDALLRSRRRADLRAHLAARGSTASMRRLLFIGVLALLVFRRRRSRMRRC